jgi:hypothetical protein
MSKLWTSRHVDKDVPGFELTAQQEAERGDVITAAELLERLRR